MQQKALLALAAMHGGTCRAACQLPDSKWVRQHIRMSIARGRQQAEQSDTADVAIMSLSCHVSRFVMLVSEKSLSHWP